MFNDVFMKIFLFMRSCVKNMVETDRVQTTI